MIERTIFEEEHELFRSSVRKFLEDEAIPHHDQWEKQGYVDRELWRTAGSLGLLAPNAPEEYGGTALDFRYNAIVVEEVMGLGLSGIGWQLHSDIAVPYITRLGTDAQKEKYLPGCISGDLITAIAMTEPGTGSDLQSVKTTAVKDGDEYVINGSKTFITNGYLSDLVIVVAKTDPKEGAKGISLFLVETGTPGFEKGERLEKIGMKAQDTAELFFNDVRVPADNLLGAQGRGFAHLMEELPQERLSIAVGAMASSESIFNQTVEYVNERKAFGQSILGFQNTQFKLAELSTELVSARVFLDRCIELHLEGELSTVMASQVKLLTSELQGKVVDECLQLFGGYGYMWEYPVARAYADARVQRIYGGTSEVMKTIISRSLFE